MQAELIYVANEGVAKPDKHGVLLMWGRTSEYIDPAGVFQKGALVTCYNPDLWDRFVVGLKVQL